MTKKLNISKGSVRQTVKEWTIITLGVLLYSFAWVSIILPADGMGGGATGIAMLVYYATGGIDGGVPIGISYFVVNAILITAAVFIIGAKFGIKTIYSIILMSIAMSVMQAVIPNNILGLANDKLLSALLGGGVAELVARVLVCLLLPAAVAGGEVSAAAPHAAYVALCLADPMAWFAADLVMMIPFVRNILKMDYRYLYKRRA